MMAGVSQFIPPQGRHDRAVLGRGRFLDGNSLGTDTHAEPEAFRCPGKAGIRLFCPGMTPGHRRDEQRGSEGMIKEAAGQIDSAHIAFRQGIVHEPDICKPGIAAFNRFLRTDAEVVELSR